MTRPGFVQGVCLVANVVTDRAFRVDASREAIDAALEELATHDRNASLASGSGRVLASGDDPSGAGLVVDVGPSHGDWLDGYDAALAALAVAVPLGDVPPAAGTVAVVGLMLDRREADRQADALELSQMLEALGLEVRGAWPSLDGLAAMAQVGRAETLIALPYGRRAARALAARTGARVLDTGLPIGLAGTADWIRQVAGATGSGERAEALIAAGLDRAAPRLEWVVPHWLLHRRLFLSGDAPRVAAWADAFRELGCAVVGGTSDQVPGPDAVDLCIGGRPMVQAARAQGTPALERGFPSPGEHVVFPAPELGFTGVLGMVEAVINRLSLSAVMRHWRVKDGPPADPLPSTGRPADR